MQLLVILIAFIALLLIGIVLIQNPKGGGVDSTFGGGSANQMFGASKSNKVLETTTWTLAAILIVLSVIATLLVKSGSSDDIDTGTGMLIEAIKVFTA